MARKFRFAGIELDADEVIAEIKRNPDVASEVVAVANEAAQYWRSIAPVGDPKTDPTSGDYKDSIGVRFLRDRNGILFARVEATDHKAHWIEYGTGDPYPTPEFRCMRKTKEKFQP